jgi:hypothetical protein
MLHLKFLEKEKQAKNNDPNQQNRDKKSYIKNQ